MDTYTIGAAADEAGVTAHTLRYYERAGAIPQIARDASGRRRFTTTDLDWIAYARCLRAMGMDIASIAAYVDAAHRDDGVDEQMSLLAEHLERMRDQRAELDVYIKMAETKLANAGNAR